MSMSKDEIKEVIDAICDGKDIVCCGKKDLGIQHNYHYDISDFQYVLMSVTNDIYQGKIFKVKKDPVRKPYDDSNALKLLGRIIKPKAYIKDSYAYSIIICVKDGFASFCTGATITRQSFGDLFQYSEFADVEDGKSNVIGVLS